MIPQTKFYSRYFLLLILLVAFLAQCNPSLSQEEVLSIAYINENCSSCHSLTSTPKPVAPSIAEIKMAYSNNSKTQDEFLEKINLYIKEPNAQNSVQSEWVTKFGIMPKMGFSEKRLKSSLIYLYQKDWGSKEWTDRNQKWLSDPKSLAKVLLADMTPLEIAQGAAMKTKSTLGSQLMKAIQEKGTEGAIQFCNTTAIPLTNKMSQDLKLDISRVSDRARNPNNQASDSEKSIIEKYKADASKGNKLTPTVVDEESRTISYFPVETNAMCLQCHGTVGKELKKNVHETILKLYPKDAAVGYSSGEIRGLFKVVQLK
jgi:cytochrome c551/c552